MMNTLSNFSNQEFIDKSNWEGLSLFEIDELIEKYPYFSFLHLLKARKNRIEGYGFRKKGKKKRNRLIGHESEIRRWHLIKLAQRPIPST